MRAILRALVLAIVMGAGTYGAGWWTVPLIAVIWTRMHPHAAVRTTTLAAGLGWAGLLAWTAWQVPVLPLAQRVSGVLLLPSWGLLAATLAFPALLAATAARTVRARSFR